MAQGFDNIPEIALDWHRSGQGAALATVIQTWGSAPRPAGSQLVISGSGEIMGSVSGGCVEGAVVVEALEALEDGQPRVLEFGVSDEDAFAVGLACGGEIKVMVEPVGTVVSDELLQGLCDARAARQPVAYVVDLESGARKLTTGEDAELRERFLSDKSGVEGQTFIAIHNPPLRMAIVGAVHIAQPLVQMANLAGYDTILIDPRAAFGSASRFEGQDIVDDWPDEALRKYGLDRRTAVVTLSHDPKIDDPALITAIKSDAFYVGALGSTRTHAKRVTRLAEAGFTEKESARIHAPVGLNIAAKSPAEIAVSILAEITDTLRKSG